MRKKDIVIMICLMIAFIAIVAIFFFEVHVIDFFNFLGSMISRFFVLYAIIVAIVIFLDNEDREIFRYEGIPAPTEARKPIHPLSEISTQSSLVLVEEYK